MFISSTYVTVDKSVTEENELYTSDPNRTLTSVVLTRFCLGKQLVAIFIKCHDTSPVWQISIIPSTGYLSDACIKDIQNFTVLPIDRKSVV